ncbi:hypothetical protein IAU60_004897 [Kwoniella sp. DSM 27419]
MYRLSLRSLAPAAAPARRAFSTCPARLNKGPRMTQGHATDKGHSLGHKDGDVQSASVRAGQNAKDKAQSESTETDPQAQPFDAARQGHPGGSAKSSDAEKQAKQEVPGQSGAFNDQIGGQDDAKKGVEFGKTEEATDQSLFGAAKQKVASGFDGLKKMRSGKNFHTSARAYYPGKATSPSADTPGARQPGESTPGDQNDHLKHKDASEQDSGKGNAADTPHLPSQSKAGSSSGSSARGLHTSARRSADHQNEHLKHEDVSKTQKDAAKGEKAAGNPNLPNQMGKSDIQTGGSGSPVAPQTQDQKPTSTGTTGSAGGQRRGLHTTARRLADHQNEHLKHEDVSKTQKDAAKGEKAAGNPNLPNQMGKSDIQTGGSGSPVAPQTQDQKPTSTGTTGSAGGQRRGLHTSAHASAAQPPKGYAKAHTGEPHEAGYAAPPEALPPNLESPYGSDATPSLEPGLTPSNKMEHSSTAVDPPNRALKQAALDGTLGERNQQPDGEVGKLGNKEAWKHRK